MPSQGASVYIAIQISMGIINVSGDSTFVSVIQNQKVVNFARPDHELMSKYL